jgi:hypothetical protein
VNGANFDVTSYETLFGATAQSRILKTIAAGLIAVWCLAGCSSEGSNGAMTPSTATALPPSWAELRTTYQPLLTKNGVSKGCNFAPDPATCFAGLYQSTESLQTDIAAVPPSSSKSDVQNQIDNFVEKYTAWRSSGTSNRLSSMTLDVNALGIWRALLQAT